MTPRDLIAAARQQGFEPVHRTLTGHYTWVWQKAHPDGTPIWRVEVTKPHNSAYPWEIESMIHRSDVGWYPIDKCAPYNCVQAAAILRAVGVLPSPTGERASGGVVRGPAPVLMEAGEEFVPWLREIQP